MKSKALRGAAFLTVGFLAVPTAFLTGCNSSRPFAPADSPPFTVTELRVGTGAVAASGDTLTVDYTGWLYDANAAENKGTQIDTSSGRGPFTFVLGAGAVISGWDQGLVGMRVGGLRRLVIPSEFAYGQSGSGGGIIPPNASLVFDVELLSIP